MITHIEKPILASELSKIYTSDSMMKSEKNVVRSIIQEINQNKNVLELDKDCSKRLMGILEKHIGAANIV